MAHYLTTAEVAERFRVGTSTIHNWVNQGRLPALRLPGKQLRFNVADIEALEQRQSSDRDLRETLLEWGIPTDQVDQLIDGAVLPAQTSEGAS